MKKITLRMHGLAFAVAGLLAAGAAPAAQPAAGARANLSTLRDGASYQRFIVRYRAGSAPAADHAAAVQSVGAALGRGGLAARNAGAAAGVTYLRKTASGADVLRTRKLNRQQAQALIQQLAADPAVEHVEPDAMMHAIGELRAPRAKPAEFTPDDPRFAGYQWDYLAGDGASQTVGSDATAYANRGGADIAKAWDLADGSGVTVAVLDTGITHHPDLDTSLGEDGYDFISDAFVSGRDSDSRVAGGWDLGDWTTEDPWLSECTDSQNPPEPSSWHGSHVSGTIAEITNNGVGLAGTAFGAKVLPVRVLGHCGGYTSDIADAIEWASGGHVEGIPDNTHPVQVISMSLGGGGACSASDETGKAIADAVARGVAVVVAAGNADDDAGFYSPASCPGAIAVGSIGITGKRAFYSNFGDTVALAAPGGGIYANDASSGTVVDAGFVWSTVNGSETTPDESDYVYGGMAGTSQATPHVSGAAALVIGAVQAAGLPALTPAALRDVLTSTARAFPNKPDQALGAGILDARAAVAKAVGDNDGGGGGDDGDATVLNNGDTLSLPAGATGQAQLYKIEVPAGASAVVLRTFGGSGDVSLFAKLGAAPTDTAYDRSSVHVGNNESIVITRPAAGTYYLRVVGAQAYSGVSVQASYIAP